MAPFSNLKSIKTFLDVLPVGTAVIGLRGTILVWDRQSEKLFGISEKDVIGTSIFKLFPNSQATLEKYLSTTSGSRRRTRKKIFQRNVDGKEQFIEVMFTDLPHIPQREAGVMLVFRDVTIDFESEVKRRKAEDNLQKSEERFRTLFDLAPDVIYLVSKEGKFTELNQAFEKITGFKRSEWIGKSYKQLTHPDDIMLAEKKFNEGINGRTPDPYELRIKTSRGKYIIAEFRSQPRKLGGKIEGKFGIFRDITERKHAERQRDYMLGIASHELRTPLASIKVFTQILSKKFNNAKNKTYLTYIEKIELQIDKLTKLISDLLDIERIRAGRLEILPEIFNFDELVKETITELQPSYTHKFFLKGLTKQYIQGDKLRIGRVLTNLLTNAVKYSPGKKKVIITVKKDGKNIVTSIKDFGIGISPENIYKIFEPFYQANTGDKQKIPSIGLGLYISSELIRVHDGKIWVESKVGKGSTFFMTLPIKQKSNKQETN